MVDEKDQRIKKKGLDLVHVCYVYVCAYMGLGMYMCVHEVYMGYVHLGIYMYVRLGICDVMCVNGCS